MKRVTKKDKRRLLILTVIFIPLLCIFVCSMASCWAQIYKNVKETNLLKVKYASILEEEENLKSEIKKLQDPEYVARYAREKYLYSKDGELIIKIN
ncbi:MAG: septum formation initiator family protein [Bacilli bacterium]